MENPEEILQKRIVSRVERLLLGKNVAEICRRAHIPESSLSQARSRGTFTFKILAPALGTTVEALIRPSLREEIPEEVAAAAFYRVLEDPR